MAVLAFVDPVVPAGGAGFLLRGWVWPPEAAVWPIMALQVVGSLAGVFCLIRAYQWGEASYVSVFEYSIMVSARPSGCFCSDRRWGHCNLSVSG